MPTKNLSSLFPKKDFFPKDKKLFLWSFLALAMAFFPLFNAWVGYFIPSGPEGIIGMMGGSIPYADAYGYWEGAFRVLHRGLLDEWNMRRPLNALFFAFRLAVCKENVWGAFLIQSGLLAFSLVLYLTYMGRILGKWPTLIAALLLFEYSYQYTHTTLSEILGLTLGLLSFTLLWGGWVQEKIHLFLLGLGALTVALSCRAGPHMLLPALLILLWMAPLSFRRYRDFFGACLVVGGCFLVMSQISYWYQDPSAAGQFYGNFAHTLFGLVSGGKTWTYVYQDPTMAELITGKSEAEFAKIVYKASLDVFLNNPFKLALGLIKNLGGYVYYILRMPARLLGLREEYGLLLSVPICGYMFFRLLTYWKTSRRNFLFLLMVGLGILGSASVVWSDGGMRTFAVAIPFVGCLAASACTSHWRVPQFYKTIMTVSIFLVGSIFLSALSAPWIGRFSSSLNEKLTKDQGPLKNGSVIAHPSSHLYVVIEKKPFFLKKHTISFEKFLAHSSFHDETGAELKEFLEERPHESWVLFTTYDYGCGATKLMIGPASLLEIPFSWARVRVKSSAKGHFYIINSIEPL